MVRAVYEAVYTPGKEYMRVYVGVPGPGPGPVTHKLTHWVLGL